ncbi:hypothetical protein OG800_29135 [Streptomyces sp. NBC_00445]|uniref:hypothetical protein n=1 Tax=Streptomyces sp. NBC_00445 TaxID=2975745 RepID=UPI002E204B00
MPVSAVRCCAELVIGDPVDLVGEPLVGVAELREQHFELGVPLLRHQVPLVRAPFEGSGTASIRWTKLSGRLLGTAVDLS